MNDTFDLGFSQWFQIARPILTEAWARFISETPEVLQDMTFEEFCQEVYVEA